MKHIAVVFDNRARPETTGFYCQRALEQLIEAGRLSTVQHLLPSDLPFLPRNHFDLYVIVDDGIQREIPEWMRPAAFWAIDTHVEFERCLSIARQADATFAAQRDGVTRLQRSGIQNVDWLPLACDAGIHSSLPADKRFNVGFVGNVVSSERERLLRMLAQKYQPVFVGQRYFEEMAQVYAESCVVFNRSIGNDINMRVFEGLCSGSLLLTNALDENGLSLLFQDGRHLATYHDDDELFDKLDFYLANDSAREAIAAAGRNLAVTEHTYRHRMQAILDRMSRAAGESSAQTGRRPGDTHPDDRMATRPLTFQACATPHRKEPTYFEFDRPDVLELVPRHAKQILDVGCGSGRLGVAIKARQVCEVTGIELNPAAAAAARRRLDRVVEANIENDEVSFDAGQFDCVICADVIEHLREPGAVLERIRGWLAPQGCLVCSVPNVRHQSVIRSLLAGNWTYESAGLLDADHVRFFTRREIEKLLFRSGFELDELRMVPGEGYDEWAQSAQRQQVSIDGLQIRTETEADAQEFFAYQWLTRATIAGPHPFGCTSIILVTHNQLAFTKSCLDSIRLRTDEPYELIIVDNASTDGTSEYLETLDDVRLITNDTNRGFPAAVNQGMAVARGDHVLLLNNDTIVTTGWLRRLLDVLHSVPDVGLVGPVSNNVGSEQQIPVGYVQLAELDGWAWDRQRQILSGGQAPHDMVIDTNRLVGFCLLIKREVIERIGVLDERFGIGCFEDDDLCRRAIAAGYRAVIAPAAFVHHFGSVTFRANGIDLRHVLDQNRRIYEEKWGANEDCESAGEARENSSPTRRCDEPPLLPDSHALAAARRSRPKFIIDRSPSGGLMLKPNDLRLSACLIVRDNERTIGPCLESIRPWVDEIIVVDTGSSDRTAQICRSLGARVFYWAWRDDFAAARNVSLDHARGEWLFWMDSDDTIPEQCGRRLRDLVGGDHDACVFGYVMQVHCPGADASDVTVVDHVKLVRNRPEIGFEFRIHEQVLPSIRRAGGEVRFTDIYVVHSGNDHSPAARRRKLDRDFRLLHLEHAERGDHPFVLFNLGMTHADAGHAPEAVEYLQRCISVSDPQESHLRKAYALHVSVLAQCGNTRQAINQCQSGLRVFPDDKELLFRRAMLHHEVGELAEAAALYRRVVDDSESRHFCSIDQGVCGFKAQHNLAVVLREQGRIDEAIAVWRMIIQCHPSYPAAWRRLGELLLASYAANDVQALVDELASNDLHEVERHLLLSRLARHQGDIGQAIAFSTAALRAAPSDTEVLNDYCRLHFEQGTPFDATESLLTLEKLTPDDPAVQHNLGIVELQRDRLAQAVQRFERSLALRPGHAATLAMLAEARELSPG